MADPQARAGCRGPCWACSSCASACALFPDHERHREALAATYDRKQIVWFRIVVHLVLVALVFTPRMGSTCSHARIGCSS
jgi:hypothetical protein